MAKFMEGFRLAYCTSWFHVLMRISYEVLILKNRK
ncbi:MAG: hypothetical protein K0Q78_1116 [Cellvibrio sp.]|nr:hypothetical protein [Cellvibrio sp.]